MYVPDNIATRTAHQMMQDLRLERFEREQKELEKQKKWPDKLQCCKCKKHYPSDEMKHVLVKSRRNGKRIKYWRHYCEICFETYKPNSKRVGGRNY